MVKAEAMRMQRVEEALLDLVFDWLGVRSPFEVETSAYESKAAA